MSQSIGKDFAGLTAIVTGAGSGIGLEVARKLSDQGAKVFGFDLRAGEMAELATFIECDIANPDSVKKAFAEFASQSKTLDILINNAGIGAIGTVEQATEEEWLRVFNVNVFGTGRMSAAAMPYLKASKSAAIVNTCSLVATAGVPNRAVYGASKGAIYALTLAMATDGIAHGVRVNCVNPGTSDTPWIKNLLSKADNPDQEYAALQARQPIGRLVSPVEVASAIVFLANPAQASTTGTALGVDGGMQGLRLPR
jgi:NAD(P)-dependent dehydrogenase (short-subunit alcohol dehydrogenase family)